MTPPSDFPAAHSMDTMWFAVDRDGHVAVFDSGEAGAVPTDGYTDDWVPIVDELIRAGGGKADEDDDIEDNDQKLVAAGFFYYRHDEWENAAAGPYDRLHAPAAPLPGHQVPRELLKEMVSFDGRFADTAKIQPLEHWPSDAWGPAWIATDGTSVHCIPGHEAEYAAEIAQLESANEGQALTFDAPTVAVPSKPVPPARALPARRWWEFWKK